MAELKTKPSKKSVREFVDGIEDEDRRRDSKKLVALMKEITGEKPQSLDQVDENVFAERLRRSVAHVQDVEAEAGGLSRMSEMPPPGR